MITFGIVFVIWVVVIISYLRFSKEEHNNDVKMHWVDPNRKAWEYPALMTYLKDNPYDYSMKNIKVLEILRDNRKLTKEIQALKHTNKNLKEEKR